MITRQQFAKWVGQKIKDVRYELRLTQVALSKKTGISQNFISVIENGCNSIDVFDLWKIADVTGKSISWFIPFAHNELLGGPNANERDDNCCRRSGDCKQSYEI